MSEKQGQEKDQNITVINDEYDRVLSNPDNVIISEDLQQLLDIDLKPVKPERDVIHGVDSIVLTVLDRDGLPNTVRGKFSCLSKSQDGYAIIVTCPSVKKQFLSCLNIISSEPGLFVLEGLYEIEITDCQVISWSTSQTATGDFSLSIQFRSENEIF